MIMNEEQQIADAHKAFDTPNPLSNSKDGGSIPERQVYSAQETAKWLLHGNQNRPIKMTAGFMEPSGHGYKSSSTRYLDSKNPDPKQPKATKAGSNYNIGIDYVVGGDKQVVPWYSGTVKRAGLNGGYGNSVTIETNQSYEYNGVRYPIYNTYSHLATIGKGIKEGAIVDTDTFIGKMGGTGTNGKNTYPEHVDFQSYILVDGKKIQLSPNLMQNNLKKQAENGTFRYVNSNSADSTTAVLPAQSDNTPRDTNVSGVSQEQKLKNELYAEMIEISGGSVEQAIKNILAAEPPVSAQMLEEMAAFGYQRQGLSAEESFNLAMQIAATKPEGHKLQSNVDRSDAGKQLQAQP
jgi:Peptidase family M23